MSEKIRRHRRGAAVVAVVAGATLVGSAAWAYWTFGGSGTGSVKTASTVSDVAVSQTASVGALAPGSSVPLAGSLTNPNNTDVKVGVLTAEITGVDGGAAVGDFSLTGNPVQVHAVVKKGTPVLWSGMTLVYANSAVNQDSGKAATVSIKYTLSPFQEGPPAMGTFRADVVNGVRTVTIRINNVGGVPLVPGDKLGWYAPTPPSGVVCTGTRSTYCTRNGVSLDPLATADSSGVIYYVGAVSTAVQWEINWLGTAPHTWKIIGTL